MEGSSSVTVSFRIDSALRDGLTDEAVKKHVSLNAYVGECLQKSMEWGTLQQQFDYVSLARETLQALLDQVGDKEIATIARKLFPPRLTDITNLIHGKADLDGFLQVIELMSKYEYPIPATYALREDDEGYHIFIRHGISQKWSIFIGEGCLAYLDRIQLRGFYDATTNSLKLTIQRKKLPR